MSGCDFESWNISFLNLSLWPSTMDPIFLEYLIVHESSSLLVRLFSFVH
jgi:hypothetical protein